MMLETLLISQSLKIKSKQNNFFTVHPHSQGEDADNNMHIINLIVAVRLNAEEVVYGRDQGGVFGVKAVIV